MQQVTLLRILGMLIIPFLLVFIPILLGQRYGLYRSRSITELQHGPVGAVVGSAFGLLAFMLAFTFQLSANRYDSRKALLLDEVTNIRTAWLRSGLVPEPYRSDTRKMLLDYVSIRADLARDTEKLDAAMKNSQQILDSLWQISEVLAEKNNSSEAYALYITSVNDLVDNFNQRISVTLQYRIPAEIMYILAFVTFFSMLMLGYQFGISGKGSFRINILLAVIFSLVIFLILALDNPLMSSLNQKPLFTLLEQLRQN